MSEKAEIKYRVVFEVNAKEDDLADATYNIQRILKLGINSKYTSSELSNPKIISITRIAITESADKKSKN